MKRLLKITTVAASVMLFTMCENHQLLPESQSLSTDNLVSSQITTTIKSRFQIAGGSFVFDFVGGTSNEKLFIEDPIQRRTTYTTFNSSGRATFISNVNRFVIPGFYAFKIGETYQSVCVLTKSKLHETKARIYLGEEPIYNNLATSPACFMLLKPKSTEAKVRDAANEIMRNAFLDYTDNQYKNVVLSVKIATCGVTNTIAPGSTARSCMLFVSREATKFSKAIAKSTIEFAIKNVGFSSTKTKTANTILGSKNLQIGMSEFKVNSPNEMINQSLTTLEEIIKNPRSIKAEITNNSSLMISFVNAKGNIVSLVAVTIK